MKVVGMLFTGLLIGLFSSPVFSQDQELVCFNTRCFKPNTNKGPTANTDTLGYSSINETIKNDLAPIAAIEENYELEETNPETVFIEGTSIDNDPSKYYEILEEDSPFRHKRFLNVPSRTLDDANNARLESTRPKVVLKHFNKPPQSPEMNFNERYEEEDLYEAD